MSPVNPLISTFVPELDTASVDVTGLKINIELTQSTSLHVVPEHKAFPIKRGRLHHCRHHRTSRSHWVIPQLGAQVITYTRTQSYAHAEFHWVHQINFDS